MGKPNRSFTSKKNVFVNLTAIIALVLAIQLDAERRGTTLLPRSPAVLPREYDDKQIEKYWMCRPFSILYRLGQIGYELAPVAAGYIRDFYIRVPPADKEAEELLRFHSKRAIHALTNLGPAWVKCGQQLTTKPDLLPSVVLNELTNLHDSVRPIPDDVAFAVMREELEVDDLESVFAYLEFAASASLGQVYKARLVGDVKDLDTAPWVAVKVQRPGMRESFSLDLFMLLKISRMCDFYGWLRFKKEFLFEEYFKTFVQASYSELDYENEARNQIYFRTELNKRGSKVKIPGVYLEYTRERVLTSEWIYGTRIKLVSPEKLLTLMPQGVELFLMQLFDIGYFHADPHPGNYLIAESKYNKHLTGFRDTDDVAEDEDRIALLDFGLCTNLTETQRRAMHDFIFHVVVRDFDAIVFRDLKALEFIPDDADPNEIKPFAAQIFGALLQTHKKKYSEISDELNEVFFKTKFRMPAWMSVVSRGIITLEGIGLSHDPNFNLFIAAAPYMKARAVALYGKNVAAMWDSAR